MDVLEQNSIKFIIVLWINGDFKCEGKDNALVAKAYDTRPGDPRWIANADINNDGKVEGKDLAIIAKYYDTHYP